MGRNEEDKMKKQPMIGIPGIDEQHVEFLKLLDELQNHLGKENPSYKFVQTALQKIMENLKVHLATEENLMEMIGFSGKEEHKIQHEKLSKQISDAAETLKKTKNPNIIDKIRSIREADVEHVALYDVEYTAHIGNLMDLTDKYNITSVRAQILTK